MDGASWANKYSTQIFMEDVQNFTGIFTKACHCDCPEKV